LPGATPAAPKAKVQADIDAILKPRWVKDIITVTLTGDDRSRAQRILTDMTDTQQRLYDLFTLDRYTPTR
jgi:hypothetical protein